MMPLEAIGPTVVAPQVMPRWTAGVELLVRMLHAAVVGEHPYAYLVATELRRVRPRA